MIELIVSNIDHDIFGGVGRRRGAAGVCGIGLLGFITQNSQAVREMLF